MERIQFDNGGLPAGRAGGIQTVDALLKLGDDVHHRDKKLDRQQLVGNFVAASVAADRQCVRRLVH